MNRINIKELAALTLAVAIAFPAVSSFADPEDDNTNLSAPLGITSPTTPAIDSVDGTGLRSAAEQAIDSVDGTGLRTVINEGTDSVDGTGLQSVSDPAIDSVDGTGLQRVATEGTDSVDGTGGPLSVPQSDLAASGAELLTIPASTRNADCTPLDDATSADSTDCTPSGEESDSGE